MNVFSGPTSLQDYHNPDKNVYLPLVELPHHPFTDQGVHVYAKMLTMTPSGNVKSLAALNMMLKAQETSDFNPLTDQVVEYSSGNTALSLGILQRIYGSPNSSTTAYVSNKTSESKLQLLRFFNLNIKLFGGPAQVEPADIHGGINAAIRDGKQPGFWNPGQYHNLANSQAHERWTGPQLYAQLPNISVFAAAIGTSGTMTGAGSYLRSMKPDIVNLGVFTAPGDRVPGPRPIDLTQSVDLPWQKVVTREEHVTSIDSYAQSLQLCREGIICGPSSGLALQGLYQFLEKEIKLDASLAKLRGPDGYVSCAFICCDLPYQYIPDFFTKLPPSLFPSIEHEELLQVDLYPYGINWRITPSEALEMLHNPRKSVVLDFRTAKDFDESHVHNSIHVTLNCDPTENPFSSSSVMTAQWTELSKIFDPQNTDFGYIYEKDLPNVILVCYDGNLASIASSILRHHGAEAFHVIGGFQEWKRLKLPFRKLGRFSRCIVVKADHRGVSSFEVQL